MTLRVLLAVALAEALAAVQEQAALVMVSRRTLGSRQAFDQSATRSNQRACVLKAFHSLGVSPLRPHVLGRGVLDDCGKVYDPERPVEASDPARAERPACDWYE